MEAIGDPFDLAGRQRTLVDACDALAGLEDVLHEESGGLGALLGLLDRLRCAVELGLVRVTAEALERGEAGARGSGLSAAQWVRCHAPSTRSGGAGAVVSLARDLAKPANAAVESALTTGRLPVRAAVAVIDEADKLGPLLAEGAKPAVVEGLIAMAADHGPRGCRMVRPRLLAQYGYEESLQREQDATKQFIALSQPRELGSGIFEYALTLDTEGKAVMEAALGPLSAPKPSSDGPDLRSSDRRRGDALIELVRRAVTAGGSAPTTTKAQLFVTMDYTRLRARLGSADSDASAPSLAAGAVVGGLDAGTLLAPETVRRIACDATLVPIVLGGDSEVLDWGRARRLFTAAQTRRLWLRDGGCTYPSCDSPAQWCDAHHLVHWADGGPSDLHNAALLCEHHHQTVHRRRLAGTLVPAEDSPGETPAVAGQRSVQWDLRPGSYDLLLTRKSAIDRDDGADVG